MPTTVFSQTQKTTSWNGVSIPEGREFSDFMAEDVSSRLNDDAGKADFNNHLNGLAPTGFAQESLKTLLEAGFVEERDWAISEALAEAWLTREYGVEWPWNMERDKRTPLASLPGADLVGFVRDGEETRLALGEVKSSSDVNTPPGVMNGRSGMTHQLEKLAADLSLIGTLIRWLQCRCRGKSSQPSFDAAISLFLKSGNRAMTLFGVLVRDTQPNERDLLTRGRSLSAVINAPTRCNLLALYLPITITSLPGYIRSGGGQ